MNKIDIKIIGGSTESASLISFFLIFIHMLSCLYQTFNVFSFRSLEPHHALVEQVFISVFIMCLVYLAQVFGTLVAVVEFENLLGRDDAIEVTEDEQHRHAGIQFLKHIQIINGENVIVCLLCGSFFYQIQQRPKDKLWKRNTLSCNTVHNCGETSER